MAYDEALAERIRALLRNRRDVAERRMFGGVAFMIRGRMGCGIIGSTLMVRVDPDDADRLITTAHARPMDFTGRPMRGFLFVDPPGLATAAELRTWVRRAAAWADAQPPKAPGTRDPAGSSRSKTGSGRRGNVRR
jgi:TfoX/Sxy family transcriptional regulator of competence genes